MNAQQPNSTSSRRGPRLPQLLKRLEFTDFELQEELGVGSAGSIFKAIDKKSERVVALKMLLPTLSMESIVAQRFEREMVILEKLDHPNIIRYLGGGVHGKQLFYAMEYVDWGTVKDVLVSTGSLTIPEVCSCGKQVCSALQAAHNFGIIHRDLKPSNLFLTADGDVKLGDFGVARDTHEADITSAGLTVGTCTYMSPEQITGEREITGKADLYSLGCLLFEMTTGQPPYQGANFAQLFEQHLHADIPRIRDRVPNCPRELDEVTWQLMQKNPEDRPFNARYVQATLMRLIGSDSETNESGDVGAGDAGQRRLSQRLRLLRAANRNVSWWALGGLAVLVIVAIVLAAIFT